MSATRRTSILNRQTEAAVRKLRLMLGVFAFALILPTVFIFSYASREIRDDTFLQYSSAADQLAKRFGQRMSELTAIEERRPFDEYGFYSVSSNTLASWQAVRYSPLSEYPVKSDIPWMTGYFQINPDGRIQTPFLPPDETGSQSLG